MSNIELYKKEKAQSRYEYISKLEYDDAEYKKNLRKHMTKHRHNARGLLNSRLTAKQELVMYETYGFESIKNYALDVLEQNIEYCSVLEYKTHEEQISSAIDFLKKSNCRDYLETLAPFATKNGTSWYVPVDRLNNWIDCFMIQREIFFKYAGREDQLLYIPNYFSDNILLMLVDTDNTDNEYMDDIDKIEEVYDKLVTGICTILSELPNDYFIDDLFNMDSKQIKKNSKKIKQLQKDYIEFMDENN
ncbi:hypothetical protein [Methanosphaera sp. WGK6]|uniref:hypothetical protein n=1 Tax=Methanosphaera sp. WGK6 TaxID=1561964 RepID=UPI00084BD4F5|nr:hypothetical protein [Methanosphaera sp. WGK6]OED30336.1 hypothetical protein NL43_02860 [Methanosphaera sp. WGK6]